MATAYTYTLSKRHNSTLQPTGTGTSVTLNLKGGSDLLTPVFLLNSASVPAFNYVLFEGRYYFVTGIKSVRDQLYEVSCAVDVLATYKAAITAASAYVLYYTHTNNEIVDHRLSTKTAITVKKSTEQFNNLGTGESYMLTAIGISRTSVFACDKSAVDELFVNQTLVDISNDYAAEINDIHTTIASFNFTTTYEMLKALWDVWFTWLNKSGKVTNSVLFCDDAQKFVKNCFVLPIEKSHIGGTSHNIKLGKWDSNSDGNMGFPRIVHDSATLTIPWPTGISDWRRNEPYTEIYLYIPYIGMVNIPASQCIGCASLTVNVAIDTYSGVASFVVNLSNGTCIGQYSTNIAAPYAIGSSNISLTEAGASLIEIGMGVGAAAAGAGGGGIINGALGLVNSIKPFPATIGSNGGAAGMGLGNTVECFTVFHDTAVNPHNQSAIAGEPYNGVMSLGSVPANGYVQTSGASVAGSMTDTEREQINQLLDGGIYIE